MTALAFLLFIFFFFFSFFTQRKKKKPSWHKCGVIRKQINKHRKFAHWRAVSFRPVSAHFQGDGEPSFLVKPLNSGAMNLPERTHWQLSCNDIDSVTAAVGTARHVSHQQMLHVLQRRTQRFKELSYRAKKKKEKKSGLVASELIPTSSEILLLRHVKGGNARRLLF